MLCSGQHIELAQDRFGPLVHSERKTFCHEDITKPIDDETGQAICLGVNHAVRLGHFVQVQSLAAECHRLCQPLAPPERIGSALACP